MTDHPKPTPAPSSSTGHDDHCQTQIDGAYPHCTCESPAPASLPSALVERLRCYVTGNECGTDTWADGYPCKCKNCRLWLEIDALRTALAAAESQAKGLEELYDQEQRVLGRIVTALGVQLDWHCEPFPAEEETIAAIAELQAKLNKAESVLAFLENMVSKDYDAAVEAVEREGK